MAIKETKIVTLFDDSAKEIALAPRTKIEAISDLNGTGLDAILNTKISKEDTVGRNTTGIQYTIDGETVVAEEGAEIFNNYALNKASGEYSHAEGARTIASGKYSHAEGIETIASGTGSHVEGVSTTASNRAAHSEGEASIASGYSAHAEGQNTTASGYHTHSEGYYTTASGSVSHAEGYNTTASGNGSHVEGYKTTAFGDYQHVQGKYNITDIANKYAHIVGNGTSDTNKSNAHTVDWDGNAWFAGKVFVGGTSQDDAIELGTGGGTQSDWNVNDENDPAFVKNRPFYTADPVETTIIEQTTFELQEGMGFLTSTKPLEFGQEYTITLDGTTYNCVAKMNDEFEMVYIGNAGLINAGEDTGELFFVAPLVDSEIELGIMINSDVLEHTISISCMIPEIYKIEEKYLPKLVGKSTTGNTYIIDGVEVIAAEGAEIFNNYTGDYANIASGYCSHAEGSNTVASSDDSHAEGFLTKASGDASHAEGWETRASGQSAHAEGRDTTASNYSSHAEGASTVASGAASHAEGYYTSAYESGSHAEGYDTSAVGYASHAEGYRTEAKGNYSHAEGKSTNIPHIMISSDSSNDKITSAWKTTKFTLAKGDGSHAEGEDTLSLGYASHAEGWDTIASGQSAHAEGYLTTASGINAHAEGDRTTSSGIDTHAEGFDTTASGNYSHAEGYQTKASSEYQHVQGKYNIEDTNNKYAHIVGNGNYGGRSNAHTLDWDGNAWYQGNVNASNINALNTIRIGNGIMTYDSSNNRIVISFTN